MDRVRTTLDYTSTSTEGLRDYGFMALHDGAVDVTHGRNQTTTARGGSVFYPVSTPLTFHIRELDVTTVRLPAERLARAAQDLTGTPGSQFVMHDITPLSAATNRYWRAVVNLAVNALRDPELLLNSPMLGEELTRTLAHAALRTFPNSTLTTQYQSGPGATAPATIRRAIDYLERNAHLPVQLADVAAAAGTSARALQYGFRRHLGVTPLEHLRRIRLERAHHDLQQADPTHGDTVTAIAARWGFAHPGRFARAYTAAYGTPPSRTLST